MKHQSPHLYPLDFEEFCECTIGATVRSEHVDRYIRYAKMQRGLSPHYFINDIQIRFPSGEEKIMESYAALQLQTQAAAVPCDPHSIHSHL